MTPDRAGPPRRCGWLRMARLLLGAALTVAALTAGPAPAGEASNRVLVGMLWLPDGVTPRGPIPLVLALHDAPGIDARAWRYGEQITAAGIAVLQVDLHEVALNGADPPAPSDGNATALARLAMVLDIIAADPRFGFAPIGLLAFGSAAEAATLAAIELADSNRFAALVLLYPGCAGLEATIEARTDGPRAPVLLLHGDVDPANPPLDCMSLAARLARTAPVRRVQYAGAGYAWDRAPTGPWEVARLPWPGRPGQRVPATYWPAGAELSATQAASFFAAGFASPRP